MTISIARVVFAASLLTLGGAQIIRNLAVALPPKQRPGWLEATWSSHPRIQGERMMARIGAEARVGTESMARRSGELALLARRAPLDPTPYLIAGALAEKQGNASASERLFVAARTRNPRAPAARYFLATRYLKTDRIDQGLEEIASTARLMPNMTSIVPAIASFIVTTGNTAALEDFLRRHTQYRNSVLYELSGDPKNADLVMRLAGPPRSAAPSPDWREKISTTLIDAGQFAQAKAFWNKLVGTTAQGLFNPDFSANGAPPPFNWRYASGSAGLAEPRKGGGLEVVYFGRVDAVFAEQTMVLPPGVYQLSATVAATTIKSALAWRISCLPNGTRIAGLSLDRRGAGRIETRFTVPADCGAQKIELVGTSEISARTSEVTLKDLSLTRVGR